MFYLVQVVNVSFLKLFRAARLIKLLRSDLLSPRLHNAAHVSFARLLMLLRWEPLLSSSCSGGTAQWWSTRLTKLPSSQAPSHEAAGEINFIKLLSFSYQRTQVRSALFSKQLRRKLLMWDLHGLSGCSDELRSSLQIHSYHPVIQVISVSLSKMLRWDSHTW
jgi:hypothetical protein